MRRRRRDCGRRGWFAKRLRSLPAETRCFLTLAAAEPLGDPTLLWRAAEQSSADPGALAHMRWYLRGGWGPLPHYGAGWDDVIAVLWGVGCAAVTFGACQMLLAITFRLVVARLTVLIFRR